MAEKAGAAVLPPKILIILHQELSTPGRVGRLLRAQGCELDIRRPRFGDPLPATMAEHDGAIIFGGPMSAADPDDFIRIETDWIGVPLKEDKPFLGLCLGAQLLARHLGARIFTHEQGPAEIGYYPLEATAAGARLCAAPFPRHVYHWHRDGFDLPRGADLLARGDAAFPTQAFRHGSGFGFQFHPEVTYAMMCRWTVYGAARLDLPGAQPRQAHLDGWFQHDRAVALWIDSFLEGWRRKALDCGLPEPALAQA